MLLPPDIDAMTVYGFFLPNTTTAAMITQIDSMLASINQFSNITSILGAEDGGMVVESFLKALENTSVDV